MDDGTRDGEGPAVCGSGTGEPVAGRVGRGRELQLFDNGQRAGRIAVGAQADKAFAVAVVIGPEEAAVGFRDGQGVDCSAVEKTEMPLVHGLREARDPFAAVKEKHKPVARALVAFFRNVAEAVEIGVGQPESGFLFRLAPGAFVGGFARLHVEFAADGAPAAFVGRFEPADQQMFPRLVAEENQGADTEGEGWLGGAHTLRTLRPRGRRRKRFPRSGGPVGNKSENFSGKKVASDFSPPYALRRWKGLRNRPRPVLPFFANP